ncbi:diacylglycerol kinase [Paraburkholderia franconis]|uniref:diacylglycerol kinase n=1 Tax=Paraburkholderia franconis TaxID=2654983 RepID=UPI0038993438
MVLAWLRPPLVFSALCMTMAVLVLAAELFNTALERLADQSVQPKTVLQERCYSSAQAPVSSEY